MLKKKEDSPSVATHIGEATKLEGILITDEPVKIDGTILGDVKSTSTVIVGPSGVIDGNLYAKQLYVAGQIKGDATVEGKTQFVAGGYLSGNITSADLVMEMGASIDGMCKTNNHGNEVSKLTAHSTPTLHSSEDLF